MVSLPPPSPEGPPSVGVFCGWKVPRAAANGLMSWGLGALGRDAVTVPVVFSGALGGSRSPRGHVGVSVAMARGSRGHAAPFTLAPCSARWECPACHRTSGFCPAALVLSHVLKPPQRRGRGGSGRRGQEAGRHPPDLVVWLWHPPDLQQQTGIAPLRLPGQAVPACVSPSSGFASIFLRGSNRSSLGHNRKLSVCPLMLFVTVNRGGFLVQVVIGLAYFSL